MEDFPSRLRRIRKTRGISPYHLAQLTGMSKQGVLNLEASKADPKLSTVLKLADALGVPARDLLPEPSTVVDQPPRKLPQQEVAADKKVTQAIKDALADSEWHGVTQVAVAVSKVVPLEHLVRYFIHRKKPKRTGDIERMTREGARLLVADTCRSFSVSKPPLVEIGQDSDGDECYRATTALLRQLNRRQKT